MTRLAPHQRALAVRYSLVMRVEGLRHATCGRSRRRSRCGSRSASKASCQLPCVGCPAVRGMSYCLLGAAVVTRRRSAPNFQLVWATSMVVTRCDNDNGTSDAPSYVVFGFSIGLSVPNADSRRPVCRRTRRRSVSLRVR